MTPSSYVKGALGVLPHATSLDTTADYHSLLLDQTQTQASRTTRCTADHSRSSSATATETSHSIIRPWTAKRPGSSRSMKSIKTHNERRSREENAPCPPDFIQPIATYTEITAQELEEFKSLPATIRRKYFTTSEQLQLVQSTSALHSNSSTNNNNTTSNVADLLLLNEKAQPDRSGRPAGNQVYSRPSPLYQTATNAGSVDRLPLNHSSRPRQDTLTREEQVALAKQLRESVILDAATEALSKAGHRQVRHLSPPVETPTLSSGRPSMDSRASDFQDPPTHHAAARDSFYDSFRWLEEDEDLDLTLHIDDYHANPPRETMPSPPKERRPSIRRRLSINKNPFGKLPGSLSRPGTKDMNRAPSFPTADATTDQQGQQGRRKSRALSLITPRQASHVSMASVDSAAAHYQDPEARLKLRAYLSSPQKFDEAVQFGFPSNDAGRGHPRTFSEPLHPKRGQLRRKLSDDSEKLKTFLSDDRSSIYSDELSTADPDTPMTPHSPDREKHGAKNAESRHDAPPTRDSENSLQAPSDSREMTLRMTLTRPDLRASEDQIYGWQRGLQQPRAPRVSHSSPRGDGASTQTSSYTTDAKSKADYERFFSELDESAAPVCEGGVMKRFWHRVTRA
ncbi:hypothetical protein PGQ11_003610 [Apiospora arundinis]|uniref:Mucin n=1 Tax=Apiospora arundinis TaxID=335852 RepID=A0ABR2J604_9PEZI